MSVAEFTYYVGDDGHIGREEFDDPQDALRWLWDQAEDAPEDATAIRASLDGHEVVL